MRNITLACQAGAKLLFSLAFILASLSLNPPSLAQTNSVSATTIVVQSSGSCIDVEGGSAQAGIGLDQWTCTGQVNQSFVFTPVSGGSYTIQAQNDGLCLDAGTGSVTTAVQVVQNPCTGAGSQVWKVAANGDGSYAVSTPNGLGCLDVYAGRTANGTILTTYACHRAANESFTISGFVPATSSAAAPAAGGFVSTMVIASSGSCMDVFGGLSQAGVGLDEWTCAGTSNQSFAFNPTSDGYFTIQPQNDNLCVDAGPGQVTTGVQLFQNACSGSPTQKWRLVNNGDNTYSITTPDTTGCFDVYAGRTANGTIVTTYACHGSTNERFALSISSTGVVQTAAPSISPASGTYPLPLTVIIAPAISGTSVYYTSDGSTPTVNSNLYSGPFSLAVSATVKAIAIASGAMPSPVISTSYTLTSPVLTTGTVTTIVVESSGSCLNVDNSSAQAGLGIDQWTCSGANYQNFVFTKVGAYYTIQPQNDGMCLDAGSGSVTTAVQVVQNPCSGSASQSWTLSSNPDGSYAVSTTNGTGCLDVYAGRVANGTILTTYACHSSTNEKFLLAGFSAGTVGPPATAVPVIFNSSPSAKAGDVVYVQGENFDGTSQVRLGNAPGTSGIQLSIVNRVGSTWLAAQLPQTWSGALFLAVSTSSGTSGSVKLNGAIPYNLDALQLVPGGAFRLLGRNLFVPGYNPVVTIDGYSATINMGASTENMLVGTAPPLLIPTSSSIITVDNGNGTGSAKLDRVIRVLAGSGDPFGLGVGWGAGFTFARNIIPVNTPCNGSADDSGNIQNAINSATSAGAAIQLPAGSCLLMNSLTLHSNLVLQGAGKGATILKYFSNYPIASQGSDLVGLRNLTLLNAGATMEGLIWKQNTRSFFQNVSIQEGVSRQLFLTANQNFIVTGTDFVQTGSIGSQNPYLFTDCAGFVFSNNTSVSVDGSPTFTSVHDALFLNNHFTRNAVNQNEDVVITTHQFVMDFQYRTSIFGNTFDVVNGPITNTNRNDGETLLTEGGGGNRTENLGTVSSATSLTLSDPNNAINVNPFGTGLPEDYGVAIVSGTGAGQTRDVVSYANATMQVDHAWNVVPDATSRYATFVWGLEKVLIEGNNLVGNPRGIWLYQTAARDVDISGNIIANGGGIFLRTYESQSMKQFDPMYNIRIGNNNIGNSDGVWMSYINVVFVNKDVVNFGTADTGIEVHGNTLTPNVPNVTSSTEDYANREGFMNVMRSETSGGQITAVPMLLGTVFQSSGCSLCTTAFVIGTGDYGTVLINNSPAPGSPQFLSDWPTLGNVAGGSVGTVVR